MEAAAAPEPAPALRLGELLVRDGRATQEHVNHGLELQPVLRKRLGEILVEKNWATSRAVAEAVAEQFGLEFIDLSQVDVDPRAAALVQEGFAHEHQTMPVRFLEDNLVQVAIADPANLHTTDELRLALGVNCNLAVADPAALALTIARIYRLTISVTDAPPAYAVELDDSVADGALDLVNTLIGKAVNDRASDVHLDPQERNLLVRFRVDGVLRETEPVDRRLHSAVAARIKVMAQLDIAEKRMPQDGSFVSTSRGSPSTSESRSCRPSTASRSCSGCCSATRSSSCPGSG